MLVKLKVFSQNEMIIGTMCSNILNYNPCIWNNSNVKIFESGKIT